MKLLIYVLIFHTFANLEDDVIKTAEEYVDQKDSLLKIEKNKRNALGQLYEINQKTKKIVKNKSDLSGEKAKIEKKISDLAKSIISLEDKSKILKLRLGMRFKELYKIKGLGFLYSLFNASSIHDLDKALYLTNKINENDKNLQIEYKKTIEELTLERVSLNQQIANLEKTKNELSREEELIKNQYLERKKVLAQLEKQISGKKKKLEILRHRGLTLTEKEKDLSGLFQKPIFELKGQLDSPAQAPILRDFAIFKGLNEGVVVQHKGLFFSGENILVKSIFEGQVEFVGDVDGFGKVLIINHGDDYYSVYGYLKKINVKQNQFVDKGVFIAEAGEHSRWSGKGLYFEIRHFSEPEDPEKWIKSNSLAMNELNKLKE